MDDPALEEIIEQVEDLRTQLRHLRALRKISVECDFGEITQQLDADIIETRIMLATIGRLVPEAL